LLAPVLARSWLRAACAAACAVFAPFVFGIEGIKANLWPCPRDEFDNKLMEMKNFALEGQQVFFRAVEELEDKFSGGIRLLVQDLVERLANEELAEDYLDDEAMSLIVDKDSCMGLVNASHDAHVGKIMKREDDARNLETKRYQDMIAGHISAERARNRDRVLQIHQFCQSSKGLSNALLIVDEDDAYDEEK